MLLGLGDHIWLPALVGDTSPGGSTDVLTDDDGLVGLLDDDGATYLKDD